MRNDKTTETRSLDANAQALFEAVLSPFGNLAGTDAEAPVYEDWESKPEIERKAWAAAYEARHDVRASIAAHGVTMGGTWFTYDACHPKFRDHWENVLEGLRDNND